MSFQPEELVADDSRVEVSAQEDCLVAAARAGHVLEELLGFKEMTGSMTGSSFWVFDALFTPQDHPAREMQDTFFIKNTEAKLPENTVSF